MKKPSRKMKGRSETWTGGCTPETPECDEESMSQSKCQVESTERRTVFATLVERFSPLENGKVSVSECRSGC